MRIAFKVLSVFWLLSPVAYAVGRYAGVWQTSYDWAIFGLLAVISTFVAFLNFDPHEPKR